MTSILKVAIDAPVMQGFDYLAPARQQVRPGQRVRVPFRQGRRVGVVVALADHSDVPPGKLRRGLELLDPEPLMDPPLTTVNLPSYEMGVEATTMLMRLIAGKRLDQKRVLLKSELIVRKSCGC